MLRVPGTKRDLLMVKASGGDVRIVYSPLDSLKIAQENGDIEPFIIGGGQIYKLALEKNLIDRVYLTRIHHSFEGVTFFPNLSEDWKIIEREDCVSDDKNRYNYSFLVLEK